jgi:hypothetical protein
MILNFEFFSFNASQDHNIFYTDLFSLMFHPDDGCLGSQWKSGWDGGDGQEPVFVDSKQKYSGKDLAL